VASGVPAETVIKTIQASTSVSFGFLPGDLAVLQRYNVSDEIVKAMAAKSNGRPIPTPATAPSPQQPPARQEPQRPATPTQSAETFNNDSILKLVKAGMSEDVILSMVSNQPGQYTLSTDNLIALKQAGVSDKVISAMVNRNKGVPGAGQQISAGTPPPPLTPVVSPAGEQAENSAGTARMFITDSNSWEISGGFSAAANRNGGAAAGRFAGGARPQTVEVIKTFGERCPGVVITMDKTQAQYIVLFDHEGGKGYARKDNKIAVFRAGGDLLYSGSTRSLGNAVKDACAAIFH
jgi:hypothetical protein